MGDRFRLIGLSRAKDRLFRSNKSIVQGQKTARPKTTNQPTDTSKMNCYISKGYSNLSNAGNKAKTDVENIMQGLSFRNRGLGQRVVKSSLLRFVYTLLSVTKAAFCLRRGDVVVLQYPFKKYYCFCCNVAHWHGAKVVTLIHDLGSFRRKKLTVTEEIQRLRHSDVVIAHNDNMKRWLQENGLKRKLEVLHIFDYLSEATPKETPQNAVPKRPRVLFAGSLAMKNNGFLYAMAQLPRSFDMVLYGSGLDRAALQGKEVDYKGFTPSDELIATSQAEYGLSWYGSSLLGGEGALGEYLPYNNPHKISLYIRCHLPIIIWQKAGLAEFVREHNIGILINSLEELDDVLHQVTPEQYAQMRCNVVALSKELSRGDWAKAAILRAVKAAL